MSFIVRLEISECFFAQVRAPLVPPFDKITSFRARVEQIEGLIQPSEVQRNIVCSVLIDMIHFFKNVWAGILHENMCDETVHQIAMPLARRTAQADLVVTFVADRLRYERAVWSDDQTVRCYFVIPEKSTRFTNHLLL